jgi:hypothetical protein
MATTKDRLHQLVEELPEGEVADSAERLLEQLRTYGDDPLARKLLGAPIDDEPETDEERAAVAEAREAITRGDVVRDEDLERELGW